MQLLLMMIMIEMMKIMMILRKIGEKIPVLDEEGKSRIFPQLVRHNLNIS